MQRHPEQLDLRQRRTRRQLAQALAQLLEEQPFQALSVTDICRRAMVHRTTFYAHFNDKQELLVFLLADLERECIAGLPAEPAQEPRACLLDAARCVFPFFAQRRTLYRACRSSGADIFPHALEARMAGALCPLLSRTATAQDPQTAAHFYTGALLSLLCWWLTCDEPLPTSQMLAALDSLLP